MPVVESCSSYSNPHEAAHKIHDELLKYASDNLALGIFMFENMRHQEVNVELFLVSPTADEPSVFT
jgi:hypothetical protein